MSDRVQPVVAQPAAADGRPYRAAGAPSVNREGVIAPGGFWLGRPKGLFLVAGVEFWERFSYYGMTGLLVLYLTSVPHNGGLNWDPASAIRFYGFYAGCAFVAPTIGGWLSSRHLGERFCILWGGIAVACGHVLLGGPVMLPEILRWMTNVDVYSILHSSDATLGKLFLTATDAEFLRETLTRAASPPTDPRESLQVVVFGYYAAAWSFHLGLLLILIGTGLIKPTVSSIISRFYPENAVAREAGFAMFMAAIYLGALSANFSAGTLGEKVGWHYGFTATAVGMIIGITAYVMRQHAYLADLGTYSDHKREVGQQGHHPLSLQEKRRILALLTMGIGTVVYATAFYQKGGLLNLVTRESVDRILFDFEIPATWFLSISTTVFVFLVPLSSRVWARLAARGIYLSADRKLALGLGSIAVGYIFISVGASYIADDASTKISMAWIIATYVCFAVGDVFIWPPQIAAVAELAPERFRSFAIGAWYLTIGLGTWLTGWVGGLAYVFSLESTLWLLCLICLAASVLIWMLHGCISRLAAS